VAETAEIADHIYLLSGGKVIEQGSPVQLKHSSSQWVQQFMQGLPDGPVPFHFPGPDFVDDLLNPEDVA
jgi:phospholipid/cholesterol/gamma-HCH transport system ATP-binding protein